MEPKADLQLVERSDGLWLSCSLSLASQIPDMAQQLRDWAARQPDSLLVSAPTSSGRSSLTYAEALSGARQILAGLRASGLRPGDRIASLLPAGLPAFRLRLACLLGNLVHCTPPPHPFRGLQDLPAPDSEAARILRILKPAVVIVPKAADGLRRLAGWCALQDLPPGIPAPDEEAGPQDWAAIFFTSGSTGQAKGVVITRGMIASNQAAYAATWPFLRERPPVLIDWMPWHHVFGGLDNLFKIIWNGGALHLAAPPLSKDDDSMIRLMAEVRPTLLIGVPLALRLLTDAFDHDPALVTGGCSRLTDLFYAGAAMEPALWNRLQDLRLKMRLAHGHDIRLLSGYGATEAASTMCLTPGPIGSPGYLGWPLPGHEIRLARVEDRHELRFKGPNLSPCYLDEDGPLPLPLDDEGYYRTGDAAVLEADTDGLQMLRFDGRLAEDFKLASGTKVRAGMLRAALARHLGSGVQDLILGGEGRERLVALIFAPPQTQLADLQVRLAEWNRANPASSTAIHRFALAEFRLSAEAGEISGKGQAVPGRILKNHAALFAALSDDAYGHATDPG